MAKTKSSNEANNAAAELANDGWQKQATADEAPVIEPAEWVTLGEGTVIEGTLMRAFVMTDTMNPGGFRVGYVVADANGDEWTFGEKAAFKTAMRALNLATTIRLTVGKKERIIDPKTKQPTAKTIWRIKLETKDVGVGPLVLDELKKSHKALVARGGDVPF